MSAVEVLKIALVQTYTHWHAPKKNRALFDDLFSKVSADAALIVLPEMFSTGFTMASGEVAETMDGPTVNWMAERADTLQKTICGSVVIEQDGFYFNRLIWMPPDGKVQVYDKRHCFRMADEHKFYVPGQQRVVVDLAGWRINLSVCYDLRFPVWLRNRNDYDVLLCVANWPAARRDAWSTLLRARAIENQAYCAGVNIVGVDGNKVVYSGGTATYAPDGTVLAECMDDAVVAQVELTYDRLHQLRAQFPVWQDADGFELEDLPD